MAAVATPFPPPITLPTAPFEPYPAGAKPNERPYHQLPADQRRTLDAKAENLALDGLTPGWAHIEIFARQQDKNPRTTYRALMYSKQNNGWLFDEFCRSLEAPC